MGEAVRGAVHTVVTDRVPAPVTDPGPGSAASPAPERLFVALRPPQDVVARLRPLIEPTPPGVRPTDPAHWHLTLRFLGPADTRAATTALDAVLPVPEPIVELGPAVTVLGRAVVVPASGLEELAARVRAVVDPLGEPDPRSFVGHLTLGYLRPGVAADPGPAPVTRPVADRFVGGTVELVASLPEGERHRYEVRARWPTIAPAPESEPEPESEAEPESRPEPESDPGTGSSPASGLR